MLIWNFHGAHLVLVFKQLLADFAGSILEICSLKVSANCQWRCYMCRWDLHFEERSKSRYPHMLKSDRCDSNVCSWLQLKSFEELNMNSEEIHKEGIASLFLWYPPKMLFLLHGRYHTKSVIFVFCLCLSLFLLLSKIPLWISIITVSFWEDVVFSRHLPHI